MLYFYIPVLVDRPKSLVLDVLMVYGCFDWPGKAIITRETGANMGRIFFFFFKMGKNSSEYWRGKRSFAKHRKVCTEKNYIL